MKLSDFFRSNPNTISESVNPLEALLGNTKGDIGEQIKALTPGNILLGEVVENRGNEVIIKMQGDLLLTARLEQEVSIEKGKYIHFEVKNNGRTITLSPLFANTATQDNVMKALQMANIPVNAKTVEMTEQMMSHGMSINSHSLQNVFRDINANGSVPVSGIVELYRLKLPVNETMVSQIQHYMGMTHYLKDGMEEVIASLPETLKQITEQQGNEKGVTLFDKMMKVLFPDKEIFNEIFKESANFEDKSFSESVRHTESIPDREGAYIPKSLEQSHIQPNHIPLLKDHIRILKEPAVIRFLQEEYKNQFLLEPEQVVDKEKVKEVYERVLKQLTGLQKQLSENEAAHTSLSKQVTNLRQNVDFMNQINQLYTYLQLPVKMNEKAGNGELFVYTDKRALRENKGAVSALLHLSMDYLGSLDIYISLQENKVNTRFMVENDNILDFLNRHMDLLTKRLSKRGYSLECEMQIRISEDAANSPLELLKEDSQKTQILSQLSFDVRA